MIALSQSRTKRMVALHGWSGVVLAVLLYVVVLSGTIAVFAHEIGVWSSGSTAGEAPLTKPVDHILRTQARTVPAEFFAEVRLRETTNGNLDILFHHHTQDEAGRPIEEGVRLVVDPDTKDVLIRREGYLADLFRNDPQSALEEFLVDLHVRLHIPGILGLLATGILGLWMMISGISGLLAHRHLVRDFFVPERPGNRLVSARDRHVLAGSWSLAFAFLLAFTGSFFSFAGSIGIPVVGMVAVGGNQAELIEKLIGIEKPENASPSALASLDYIIADASQRAGTTPDQVDILNYGRKDAVVMMRHPPREGDLIGTTLVFDGPSRSFEGSKPFLGTQPSVSDTAVGLMGPLHFGDFAGLLSKIVWVALGSAMTFVVLTGVRLWLKRRADDPSWVPFRRLMVAVTYGFPIALVASAWGFFLSLPGGETQYWTSFAFVAASVACLVYAWRQAEIEVLATRLRHTLGLSLLLSPLLRLLTGGTAWSEALIASKVMIPSIDILVLLGGFLLLYWPTIVGMFSSNHSRTPAVAEPAE